MYQASFLEFTDLGGRLANNNLLTTISVEGSGCVHRFPKHALLGLALDPRQD